MRTPAGRFSRLLVVSCFVASSLIVAACHNDSTSPTVSAPGLTDTTATGLVISVDSGLDTIGVAGLPLLVSVHIKNLSGAPSPNVTITWNIAVGGGTLASPTSVTDANGAATVEWTLGKLAGPNSIGANIDGGAIALTATGIAGPLTTFVKMSPDSQTVLATGSVLLTVRAADQFGNEVPNIPVFWTATGGTIVPDSTATGISGDGQAVFVTPLGVASYTITAMVTGQSPLSFVVTTF
ncbi:MAG TPA: Ig-like domain-containing protein [Gemmatimonadaceae bacterium]|jgi:adhesin/invasin|nr:Ig-like domain-containing protein [Gemmatimonadaceae bacterium]